MTWPTGPPLAADEEAGVCILAALDVRGSIRRLSIALVLGVTAFGSAAAQDIGGAFGQILGGMIAAGQAAAAREQWGRIAPEDRSCADAVLRRAGASIERLVAAGVMPDDHRISATWTICRQVSGRDLRQNYACQVNAAGRAWQSYCNDELAPAGNPSQRLTRDQALDALARNQQVTVGSFERMDAQYRREQMTSQAPGAVQVNAPSFDCAKGRKEFERIICQSYELSRIDSDYAALYRAARPKDKGGAVQKEALRIHKRMQDCATYACVRSGLMEGHDRMAGFVKAQGGTATTFAEIAEAQRRAVEEAAQAEARKREAEIARVRAEAARAEEERAKAEAQKNAARAEAEARARAEAAKAEEARRKWLSAVDRLARPPLSTVVETCATGNYLKSRLRDAATLRERADIRAAVAVECRCMTAEIAPEQGAPDESQSFMRLFATGEITAPSKELTALAMKQCRGNVPPETIAGWAKRE